MTTASHSPDPATDADPKRRRAPEERPSQILEAAFHEFGERGLAGARLDDIAKRAGVAKGTIYLYFPNKEELFREMIRATIVAAIISAEERMAQLNGASGAKMLEEFLTHWWTFLRSERFQTVHRLVMAELSNFADLQQFYGTEVIARSRTLLAGVIARGIARGEFRPIDPFVAARMTQALAVKNAVWCANGHMGAVTPAVTDDEVRDQVLDFCLHALRPI